MARKSEDHVKCGREGECNRAQEMFDVTVPKLAGPTEVSEDVVVGQYLGEVFESRSGQPPASSAL